MKKKLLLLTGIAFSLAILAAGGCSNSEGPKDTSEVYIYLKVIDINGEKHLQMFDSNDRNIVVIDTLHTQVQAGTKVFWALAESSGISSIKKIGPKNPNGNIIPGDASGVIFTKKKKLKIPKNAKSGEEGYYIKFKDEDGKTTTIDPYLKIPPQAGGG